MDQVFSQDPHDLRKQATSNAIAADAAYAKSKGDPAWGESVELRWGKAANEYNEFALEYMRVREVELTTAGDGYTANHDESHVFATSLETDDEAFGAAVRRTMT
ncbi:hypothetical protein [Nocardia sp. NPDC051463]|uniref:hypothetical protein n=1 Tax=Nocardia sp. NPDC051463 TaxID=3154845 RepID=UPI00342712DA